MYNRILFLCIGIMISLSSVAQVFQYLPDEKSERLYSYDIKDNGSYKPNNAYSDSLPVTKSNEYDLLVSNPSLTDFFTKSVQNYIFVGVNHDTNVVVTSPYLYNIELTIWCFNYANPGTPTSKNITLQVSYDPDSGVSYVDANVYKFSGYQKLLVEVTSIKDTSNNMILRSDLPKNFYIMSSVVVERYDNVPFTIYPWGTATNNKTLNVTWGTSTNSSLGCTNSVTTNNFKPIEFELEWLYIDDYTYNVYNNGVAGTPGYSFGASSTVSYDFKKNSTRVRLTENSFDIPLIYEHGAIIYRVRAIRPDYSNDYKTAIYGGWNLQDAGTVNLSHQCHAYFISTPHSSDSLNWQYTINFAEEGKYKHVINYFDGTLRDRQSQTKINTDIDYILTIDKIYDKEGRASIQTLPIPIKQGALYYNPDVSLHETTGNPYRSNDFDNLSCSTPDSIAPLSNSAWAKKYYSPLNPDKGIYERFVPDAKGYPFIQSVYSPDNLLLWQGGAGYENQLWNGHGTRYEYVRATQSELNSLFSGEAGNFVHYPKQVITDPNGQTSFTIHNSKGQTIATGLIGIPDTLETPIDILPDYDTGFADCFSIAFSDQNKTSNSLFIESPFYGEKNGIYSLQYKVNIPAYNTGCNGKYLWAKAYYTYAATDDCGAPQIPATSGVIGADSVLNSDVAMDLSGAAVQSWLQKGKYLASKTLSFSRPEINNTVRQFVKDNEPVCYKDEPIFVRESVELTEFPCIDSTIADTISPCDKKRQQMLLDLTPGGKWAKYPKNQDGSFNRNFHFYWWGPIENDTCSPSIFGYNVYNPSCSKYVQAYQAKVGIDYPDTVIKEGRIYTNIVDLPIDTFIYIFNEDMAAALLPLHPEYCALKTCMDNGKYVDELNASVTFKQAQYNNRFILDSIIAHDPLYLNADTSIGQSAIFDTLLYFTNFKNKRIDEIAIEQAYCSAGNLEENLHCTKYIYENEIQNFIFIDSAVKQRYYELLIGYYIGNRSFFIYELNRKYSEHGCKSCNPNPLWEPFTGMYDSFLQTYIYNPTALDCDSNKIGINWLCLYGAFARLDVLWDKVNLPGMWTQGITDVNIFSGQLSDENGAPQWMKDIINKVADGSYVDSDLNPPPTQIQDSINVYKNRMCQSNVDFIMQKLANCTTSTSVLNNIRDSLLLQCSGQGIEGLTTEVIIDAITDAGVSIGDLCHPFLFPHNTFDNSSETDYPYACGDLEKYEGLKDLLNRSQITTAMMNATLSGSSAGTFSLDGDNNPYEEDIAEYLSVANNATVSVQGYLDTLMFFGPNDTVTRWIVKLKIYASGNDTFKIFLKRKDDSYDYLHTASTSISVDTAVCINTDIEAGNSGYVAKSTAVLDITIDSGNPADKYYVWSNSPNLMQEKSDDNLVGSITCIGIKEAIEDFKTDKSTYGYDDGINHPLFDVTLTNYLNSRFNRKFTYYDYLDLMKGCALTDRLEVNNHYATIKAVFSSDANANNFIANVAGYTGRDIIAHRIKYTSSGNTHIGIDLNGVPFDSLLLYKNQILTYITNNSGTHTYLADEPLMVLDKTGCSPSTPLSGYSTTHSVDLYVNGGTQQYTLYEFPSSYTTEEDHGDAISNAYSYSDQCPGAMVIPDAALLRSKDYNSTEKQDYLTYVYGLTSHTENEIVDSISTSNLKQRIASYNGKELSYKDPRCSKGKRDLYVIDLGQTANYGYGMLTDTILDAVTGSGALFPTNLSTSISAGLKVFHKANDVYWYRYFDVNNRMWNVHIQPPKNSHLALNTFVLDSVRIGPGEDSINRFIAYGHFAALSTEVVECAGYTDFPLGYGKRVANVVLYDEPGLDFCLDSLDCEYYRLQDAIHAGKIRYLQYYDSTTNAITNDMLSFLVNNANDSLRLCTQAQKNHIMRYYHDLAGNLVKTVPPPTGSNPFAIEKETVYRYNSWNQPVYQETPDGGITRFYYDRAGRVVFSQDSKQQVDDKYSYTLYDNQGRVVETGQMEIDCSSGCPYITNATEYSAYDMLVYIRNQNREEVVRTYYDEEPLDLSVQSGYTLSRQENLLGRVSAITYYESKSNDLWSSFVEPHFGIYYSYDMQGNVKTITYSSSRLIGIKQKYKRVDYDYDQVSGKVNMLTYNRGVADQFYHKYVYDADNRVKEVYTSNDGMIWNRDAEYTYYKHGPLANLKLGDDQLQSLDYAYTIQGWLKAVNGDILRPDKDMGQNGLPGDLSYARDVVAMALNYYNNDYKPIDNTVAATYLPEGSKSMYNGNIPRQTLSLNTVGNLQRDYRYDQVQRLKLAAYAEVDEDVLSVASPSNIFKNTYNYDALGNITELNRHDGYGYHMDSLTYTYESGTNRLNMVDENIAGYTSAPHDLEQEPYTPVNNINYEYDNTGNMVRDYYGNQKVSWNHLGKITDIVDTVSNTTIHYEYDGLGNRVRKDVIDTVSAELIINNGEYYVYDASGNLLTTYNIKTNVSPCLHISKANEGLYGEADFIQFILDNVDIYGDFATNFVDLAIANENTWAVNITGSYGAGFYMQNDNDVFQRLLFATVDYLDDMAVFDMNMTVGQSSDHLFAAALINGNLMGFLDPILDYQTEREKLFEHFFNTMSPAELQALWTAVGLGGTYSTNLATYVASIEGQMPGAKMQVIMEIQNIVMNEPPPKNMSANFFNAVVFDPVIFSSPNLRTPTPNSVAPFTMFEEAILHALYNTTHPGPVFDFFNQWIDGPTLLNNNVTLLEQLTILYNALKGVVLTDFVTNASDPAATLDKAICNTEGIDPIAYAEAIVQHSTLGPLTAYADGFVPLAEDTLMLAEHHIYGSDKLAVKNYGLADSIMNTYHHDPDVPPHRALTIRIPWYSKALGDLVFTYPGTPEPWGNMHSGERYTSRKIGVKNFHITDHLGNVVALLQDRKSGHLANSGDTLFDYWQPNLADVSDYYPFGMKMPGRILNNDNPGKYGYNGQRAEQDIYKSKSADLGKYNVHYQFKFREYNPNIARFWSVDPLAASYPWNSPYAFAENRVIDGFDLEGKEWENFWTNFKSPGELKLKLPNKEVAQSQVYSTTVQNTKQPFEQIKSGFKSNPENYLSNSKATFHSPVDGEGNPTQFKVGSYIKIDITGPSNNGYVKVLGMNENKEGEAGYFEVTFGTMEGHVEKGKITFRLYDRGNGKTQFTINSMSEVDFGMVNDDFARSEQASSWNEVMDKFSERTGGTEIEGSRLSKTIEPTE